MNSSNQNDTNIKNDQMAELMKKKLSEISWVAFDTETSGPYPIKDDIVEFGAVKWQFGKEIARLEFLLKPRERMSDFIIGIHGISNEMVENSPQMKEKVHEIREFFRGSIPLAHHAPFDMGFMAIEFEKHGINLPTEPVICTSLVARKLIEGVENHKLQNLIKHFNIPSLAAHRAYEDARACYFVLQECLKKINAEATLEDLIKVQGKKLLWSQYSLIQSQNSDIKNIIQAINQKKSIEMIYTKGNKKNTVRRLMPLGLIRNPDGDYMQAIDPLEDKPKRFMLEFIKDVGVLA